MMLLAQGVRLLGIRPEMVVALIIAERQYEAHGETLVLTSVVDGTHMRASLHYVGAAVDFGLPSSDPDGMRQHLAAALGPDFDVVLEADHIHVEWQPKVAI